MRLILVALMFRIAAAVFASIRGSQFMALGRPRSLRANKYFLERVKHKPLTFAPVGVTDLVLPRSRLAVMLFVAFHAGILLLSAISLNLARAMADSSCHSGVACSDSIAQFGRASCR